MKKIVVSIALLMSITNAYSYTECTVQIEKVWTGDEGWVWLHYTQGGSAKISPEDKDQKNILSLALTALTSGKTMIIRYQEDNANCTSTSRSDVKGVYLYNRKF